jgi:AcrR family transcriptional regulator
MSRTGRRPSGSGTREAILAAARRQFGQRGYADTTIRSVAEEAGVDPGLVMHFFGSKDQLFSASVRWPFDPATEVAAVVEHGPAEAGERMVSLFVKTWDSRRGRNPIVALLRTAAHQQSAERQLRDFLTHQLLMPLVGALGCDQPEIRANLVAAHLLGLGVARYILRLEPIASMPREAVIALVAPAVQAALTGPLPDQPVHPRAAPAAATSTSDSQ